MKIEEKKKNILGREPRKCKTTRWEKALGCSGTKERPEWPEDDKCVNAGESQTEEPWERILTLCEAQANGEIKAGE